MEGQATVVQASVRKANERNFELSGYQAWVCHLVSKTTGQVLGVRLNVVAPFGCSPNCYITTDDGDNFQHVSSYLAANGVDLRLGEVETNQEILITLRQVLASWKRASGHSEKRDAIRDSCLGLRALLSSLPQTSTLAHLQDVGRIQANCQSIPDESIQQVEDELVGLFERLRTLEADDGDKILSPLRYEKFLSETLCSRAALGL